jgi:glycolate oxidase FAD binding subunit
VTPEAALREALGHAAGDGALREHEPVTVDGVSLTWSVSPADGAALGRTLELLSQRGVGVLVRGGGSRLGLGNPPRRAALLLSTERLRGVLEFDASDGVCRVAAGTPIAEAARSVREGGWELPLDPPGAGSSVGGALAAAAQGPRALGFGAPRDAVLGLEVALATGERTRCGGRVVKNVTGYDLNKLYTGSLGSLGVIEAAWLRLQPRPEAVSVWEAVVQTRDGPGGSALRAARLASARAAALRVPAEPGAAARLVVELAGEAPSVDRDARWLADELGAAPAEAASLDAVRERQGEMPGAGGLRFRVGFRASRIDAVISALQAAAAELLVHPGLGLLHAGFAAANGAAPEACFEACARAAQLGEGRWVLEEAPVAAKQGREVFGEPDDGWPLAGGLKARFDPAGILNAGRFAGCL